jgi:hypothetical protein
MGFYYNQIAGDKNIVDSLHLPSKGEVLLQRVQQQPNEWIDYRQAKAQNSSMQAYPDFKHISGERELSIYVPDRLKDTADSIAGVPLAQV